MKAHSNLKHKIVLDPFLWLRYSCLRSIYSGLSSVSSRCKSFCIIISKSKTTLYSVKKLTETAENILIKAKKYRTAPPIDVVNQHLWYSPEHKKLEIILRAINEIEVTDEKDFFKICFSSLAKKISYADPAISVPVRLKTKESFSDATMIEFEKDWIGSKALM